MAESLNTSMAWVSMREGLIQFDNGTQGARTIGVVVSKDATPAAYDSVRDLPGFYTRITKTDGTPRTVYLSMTDEMTAAKFNANVTVSVDGAATGFVSALVAAPEILHPNTKYYAHFYEITGTTGTVIEKLEFTTEDFPSSYPTSRGTYSNFYRQITADSTSLTMEYKASERYLIPTRFHYLLIGGGPYTFTHGNALPHELPEASQRMRPFGNAIPGGLLLFYDLYNITTSGPLTGVALWDGMMKSSNLSSRVHMDSVLGGAEYIFYDNKKLAPVTE
ncbi:hypothetical protein P0082_11745 [Candidatus Haliotispira prima]|uniref:Virion structural protein n=1 Tax=Candidatus Haliotispira prima TaxID=3034016 RepID=A0ABY8MGW7_9SPIO|nr:hypothetical protein P0082_11745 [Candidatus Haliotispira prima]